MNNRIINRIIRRANGLSERDIVDSDTDSDTESEVSNWEERELRELQNVQELSFDLDVVKFKNSKKTDPNFIKNLKTIITVDNETRCSICLNDIPKDISINILPCKHKFCIPSEECAGIIPWLKSNNTCPVCKFKLPTFSDALDKHILRSSSRYGGNRRFTSTSTSPTYIQPNIRRNMRSNIRSRMNNQVITSIYSQPRFRTGSMGMRRRRMLDNIENIQEIDYFNNINLRESFNRHFNNNNDDNDNSEINYQLNEYCTNNDNCEYCVYAYDTNLIITERARNLSLIYSKCPNAIQLIINQNHSFQDEITMFRLI